MKLQTAQRVKNWLGLCISNLKTDKTADVRLIEQFEIISDQLQSIITKIQISETETEKTERENG